MLQLEKRPALAAAGITLLQGIRILWLAHLPTARLVQCIPDDAFYYLVLARNFVALHRWTFDGVAPTSGFHLLWGYLLAAGFSLGHGANFHVVFVLCSLFACMLISLAVYMMAVAGEKLFGTKASWAVFLIFSSAIVLAQGTWLMESPLVLFFAASCVAQLACAGEGKWTRSLALACMLGCLGSLSRSDFGLLPFWLTAGAWMAIDVPRRKQLASAQLLGAALGVAILAVHTYIVSSHVTQASAQVKLWWAHLEGRRTLPVLHMAENAFNPLFNLHEIGAHPALLDIVGYKIRQALLLAVLVLAISFWRRARRKFSATLLFAMLCCCVSYGVLYRFDGGVQDWYIVSFVPVFCLMASAASSELPRWSYLPAVACIGSFAVLATALSVRPHAPWQEATYRTGLEIKQHPEWNTVGSWNTGVMSYFSTGRVVNLDGLVNDDLLPYIRSGTLAQYFTRRHITFVVESPTMLTGFLAKRGGMKNGVVATCIDQRKVLFPDDPFDNGYGTHLELMHVNPKCLVNSGDN